MGGRHSLLPVTSRRVWGRAKLGNYIQKSVTLESKLYIRVLANIARCLRPSPLVRIDPSIKREL